MSREWITYEAPDAPGTTRVTVPSREGWRCLHVDAQGEVVACAWSRFREVAVARADGLALALPGALAKHPHGIPFDRSRAS